MIINVSMWSSVNINNSIFPKLSRRILLAYTSKPGSPKIFEISTENFFYTQILCHACRYLPFGENSRLILDCMLFYDKVTTVQTRTVRHVFIASKPLMSRRSVRACRTAPSAPVAACAAPLAAPASAPRNPLSTTGAGDHPRCHARADRRRRSLMLLLPCLTPLMISPRAGRRRILDVALLLVPGPRLLRSRVFIILYARGGWLDQ